MNQEQYSALEFGTGGIRGIMGSGPDHMNEQTVKRVIQGFCNYINSTSSTDVTVRSVVIAYDSRHNSVLFAKLAASVFAANHISVFIFNDLETTPMLSFTIRHFGCMGGICITASHNPPQYNGIKVYWSDGAQIVPPQDENIIEYINNIPFHSNIASINFTDALENGTIKYVDFTAHDAYFNDILKTMKEDGIPRSEMEQKDKLSIVYTPLHGTGNKPATRLFKLLNYTNVFVVPEQAEPDGNFPTINKPNPEESVSLNLAIQYATLRNADLIFATDPDSDRLAVCVKDPIRAHGLYKNQAVGDYVLLNGNQTGALLLNFILSSMKHQNLLKPEHKVIKTMVTSKILEQICAAYKIDIFNTPTGFKWVAGLIQQWETNALNYKFLFGAEESFGYMFGNNVRDKDAIAALAYTSEMASFYKTQNWTLCDALFSLFKEFGAWQEDLICFDYEPTPSGMKKISNIMQYFRQSPPNIFNNIQVIQQIDYLSLDAAKNEPITCPKLDFLKFILADGSQISIRPSGTEPKLKVYLSVCTKHDKVEEALKQTHDKVQCLRYEIITYIQQSIK